MRKNLRHIAFFELRGMGDTASRAPSYSDMDEHHVDP